MSRVITFSRVFPSYHPKAGQPTEFVEKIWTDLFWQHIINNSNMDEPLLEEEIKNFYTKTYEGKSHTIRAGNRWKVGDWFSPRVWSGKPYRSKQIMIAPLIQIKKVWDVHIEFIGSNINVMIPKDSRTNEYFLLSAGEVAANDGLDVHDFINWFKIHPKKKEKFIGKKPTPEHSLDRYPNNDGDYEPDNTRWATDEQQAKNTRKNHWIEYEGVKMIVSDWAKKFRCCSSQINYFLKKGKSFDYIFKHYTNGKNAA